MTPAGFGPHHTSPESDPQALRYELDGCREKIAEQRDELERCRAGNAVLQELVTVWSGRFSRLRHESAAIEAEAVDLAATLEALEAQIGELEDQATEIERLRLIESVLAALWPDIEVAWAGQGWDDDPLPSMVRDDVISQEAADAVAALVASPVLGENGEGT